MAGAPDALDDVPGTEVAHVRGRCMVEQESAAARPGETRQERADRNFAELLQEVRVAQTGVQILFAFLLTLPFSARLDQVSGRDRVAYVTTLLAAAAASAFLLAPASYHRVVFRQNRKDELVRTASVLAVVGMAFLLVAIVGAVFVVMDVVTTLVAACVAAAGVGLGCVSLWYALPLGRRSRGNGRDPDMRPLPVDPRPRPGPTR
jgi:hypothetical protein